MEDLIEIARLIKNVGLKRPDSFIKLNESPMMKAYYTGIENGEFLKDDEAALKLYNSTPNDERYRKLKLRLREILYDTAVFIDYGTPVFSMLRKKMNECNCELIAMKQCIENGAQKAGFMIAKRLLLKARKYHLTIVEIECLYAILNHAAFSTGKFNDYLNISKELRAAQLKMSAETESEIIFSSVSVKYAVVSSDHPENVDFIANCISQLEQLLVQHDTFRIRYHYFLLRSWLGQVKRDIDERIHVCEDSITYWKLHPDIAGKLTAIFTLEILTCYFQKRNYELVLGLAEECDSLFDRNSSSWLIFKGYQLQAYLSLGRTTEAAMLFSTVSRTLKRSSGGSTKFIERWQILEGYLFFFIHINKQKNDLETYQISHLEKYLRKLVSYEFSTIQNDKEGANVGLMILHVLLLFCMKCNPTDILEKVIALDKYRRRHLDPSKNSRTDSFITMLMHFTYALSDKNRKHLNYIEHFSNVSPTIPASNNSTEDYELIPFDIIWKRMMKFYEVEI
ncbi:MAG: hypothetical protein IPM69_13570 [Ignavibacteria bacterium]|nr:hypothetical protein [Ignavibacteria bacterium]